MNKKLLLVAIITLSFFTGKAQVCTPNWTGGSSGIMPDSAQGLPSAIVGVPYAETINLKIPTDTIYDKFKIPVDSFVLKQVLGLPSTITYACNPSNCSFAGGSMDCVQLSGTPVVGDTGTHPLKIVIIGWSGQLNIPDTIKYYSIHVSKTTAIASLNRYYFDAGQNYPNPVKSTTKIYFNLPTTGIMQFKVYNLLGTVLYTQNYTEKAGANYITFDASNMADGMYFYSVSNGSNTITHRMLVDKN